MGLFDKKAKKYDGDTKPNGTSEEAHHTSQPVPMPDLPATAMASAPQSVPEPEPQRAQADYGINKMIELMRMLPDDNMELVVCVVKTTLESANVKVSTIINDAVRKQSLLEARMEAISREIAALEEEVTTRRRAIAALEADYKETSTVKDWLVVAETLATPKQAAAPAPVASDATPAHADDKK